MSPQTPATYSFLPWVRRGASRAIKETEDVTKDLATVRPTFDLQVEVNNASAQTVTVGVYGPGDIVGIDPQQVVRTEPKPDTPDFEPNYFAAVEFDLPDFVWMMTPANPKSGAKLRPWICLVVVPKSDKVSLAHGTPLPILSMTNSAGKQLPDLSQYSAWAHAQVTGDLTNGPTLDAVLSDYPERTVSRLVCPRRLQPKTAYIAAVVPTTKVGVAAGRGDAVDLTDHGPAWTDADNEVHLPVYFSWEFTTGADGDFERLARLLSSGPAPEGAGQRGMDIGQADPRLPQIRLGAPGVTLGFEGALRSPATTPTPWPAPQQTDFQNKLTKILNEPADLAGTLGPPLYGQFHAAQERVPLGQPLWLRDLNLDPRYRAAAGLGTRVVQEEQEQLMEAAWQQVGEIEKANDALRKAQLSRAALIELHERDLTPLEGGNLLQITAPTHARVRMSPQTLERQVRDSALPSAVLSTSFRRITRPSGPHLRRADPDGPRTARPFVRRFNSGEIQAAPPRHEADGTVGIDTVVDRLYPSWLPGWLRPIARYLFWILLILAVLLFVAATLFGPSASWLLAAAGIALALAAVVRAALAKWLLVAPATTAGLTAAAVDATPARPDFQPIAAGIRTLPSPSAAVGPDNEAARRFREAAIAKQATLTGVKEMPTPDPPEPLALETVRETLLERLDPRETIPPIVLSRISFPPGWNPPDKIDTIMAAPEFTSPMYVPLRDLAKETLLPGIEAIKPNTVTVLKTNPRFIEAFMVGLNHEMSRELLWREFPTDQRGTYFRYFWDQRGRIPKPTTEEEQEAHKDITQIHTWPSSARLGEAGGGASHEALVLLIRAQLLSRYPFTSVYATKADSRPNTPGRKPLEPAEERYPIFRGSFPPDITFLGFDLTEQEARGGPAPSGSQPDPGPGWFFVLQQPPTEPRFGLDEEGAVGTPSKWSDFGWPDVVIKNDHLDIAATATKLSQAGSPLAATWAENAGALAVQVLQTPFRVAISADDMLP